MNKLKRILISAILVTATAACEHFESGQEVPSFIKIDAIDVQDNPTTSQSIYSGFFSSDIDAVDITLLKEGDTAEVRLGTYMLPCTVPVMREGKIKRISLLPVVKQSGIAGSRIEYYFYETLTLNNINLTADSVTDLGTLHTHYKQSVSVPWEEFFEPGPTAVRLDTVVKRLEYVADTVKSGNGCGVVRINPSDEVVAFWTDTTIYISKKSATVYLEMDYCTDFEFEVGLYNPTISGGENVFESVYHFNINSDKGWQKIYINLGRTWSYMNCYPSIRLMFHVFNEEHRKGNLFLDNMKVVVM